MRLSSRILLALMVGLLAAPTVMLAQYRTVPRKPASPAAVPPAGAPARPGAPADGSEETTIKVDVNLVSFPATVTDNSGRYIGSLQRDQFSLYEDGVRQTISLLHNEIVPVSVGIVIDTSGSMQDKMSQAGAALAHFVRTIQPDDDVFLMRFAGDVELTLDFTGNRELFAEAAQRLEARGATRLYDALADALEKVDRGRHKKKAILLITDGRDTESRMGFEEVLEMARQSEVLVYAMGIGRDASTPRRDAGRYSIRIGRQTVNRRAIEDAVDMNVLETIADATGGRAFHLEHARLGGEDFIDQAALQVSSELRQQYTVGYYPTNAQRDGTFRRMELRANAPGLQVRHRRGYYAPREIAASSGDRR